MIFYICARLETNDYVFRSFIVTVFDHNQNRRVHIYITSHTWASRMSCLRYTPSWNSDETPISHTNYCTQDFIVIVQNYYLLQ